jgi:hypothetical protein
LLVLVLIKNEKSEMRNCRGLNKSPADPCPYRGKARQKQPDPGRFEAEEREEEGWL